MQRLSDRNVSIALSVLLHAALLGVLVYGWMLFRQPPRPKPTLAIEARVVDSRSVRGVVEPAPPQPEPPPQAPPEPVGPPQPTAEELAQREQQRQQQEAAAEEQRRAAEQAAAEAAAAEAAKRAEAERKAHEQAEAQKRAEEQQRQVEAKEQAQREEDLQRSLAAEEQARKARAAGPALASWQSQIRARITHAWLRPPTARQGIKCVLNVTLVPGGEVTEVSFGECNGDQAVRESIEAAVYRASPLPPPPDPAMFDRHLVINFNPED